MKLSLNQHIAPSWLIGAPVVFAPVIENAKRPDVGAVMAWGVAIVAGMILFTPLLLRWPLFRRWYGWTDALSERQRQAAHRASEAIQEQIREHIVATSDMRLFGLLHLLGQASLRMEQALWPEEYKRMTREVEEALQEANDPNARLYTHEEVMRAMKERIDRVRDKPC